MQGIVVEIAKKNNLPILRFKQLIDEYVSC